MVHKISYVEDLLEQIRKLALGAKRNQGGPKGTNAVPNNGYGEQPTEGSLCPPQPLPIVPTEGEGCGGQFKWASHPFIRSWGGGG